MAMMLSATSISRRVKPPSPGSGPSFATADFSRRGDAYNLTRIAAAEHDGLRRRAGADTVEENARDTLPAAGRDTHVGWPASPFEGTAGKRLPRAVDAAREAIARSEEHTSELQSLMRISYAVFCLKNKNTQHPLHNHK